MPVERADGVWAPGSVDGGPPQKGIGVDMNQAFSVDVVFGLGYALIQEHPVVFLGVAGAVAVLQVLGQVLQQGSQLLQEGADPFESFAISGVVMVVGLLNALVIYWLTVGLMGQVEVAARGDVPTIGGVLLAPRVGNAILAGIVAQILVIVPMAILLVPGIAGIGWGIFTGFNDPGPGLAALVLGGGWSLVVIVIVSLVALFSMLVMPAAVLSGGGPLDAVSAAWDAASGARITLFVLGLITAIATVAGLLCCFFPAIGVIGVTNAGMALSWLLYARPREETRQWPFFQRHASHLL